MRVTLINHSDSLGGASVVTYRLMEALRRSGVDARMLVTSSSTGNPAVEVAAPRWRARIPFLREHLDIFLHNGMSRRDLFKVSIATAGLPLADHPLVRRADVVVLNWVNQGMLSLGEIGRIAASKPTVWTMHDMWNMTGICHHACTCTRYTRICCECPLLNGAAGPGDLSQRTFERKRSLYSSARMHFVSVSDWLARRAASSALLRDARMSMIPNPFFIEHYAEPAPMTREEAGLPGSGRLVVVCAARLDDPVKGLPMAFDALNALGRDDVCAVLVGAIRNPHALDGLRCRHVRLGPVSDPERMRAIYAHSSVVLSTSHYESFGATLVEGLAAGCVPVGFVHDGRSDIIRDGVTGYAADYPDVRSVTRALAKALDNPPPSDSMARHASTFSWREVARKYISLFDTML